MTDQTPRMHDEMALDDIMRTDQTPRTEAGRRLTEDYHNFPPVVAGILAIEAQARAEAEADAVIASFAVTKAAWQNGYNAARAEALDVEVLARALNIAHKTVGQRSFTQPWTVADAEYVRRAILAGERIVDDQTPRTEAGRRHYMTLHDVHPSAVMRDILAIEAEARQEAEADAVVASFAAVKASWQNGHDDALREAAERVRALPLQDAPGWYSHERAVREADVIAILTETER